MHHEFAGNVAVWEENKRLAAFPVPLVVTINEVVPQSIEDWVKGAFKEKVGSTTVTISPTRSATFNLKPNSISDNVVDTGFFNTKKD